MKKRIFIIAWIFLFPVICFSQNEQKSNRTTVYESFQPAVITLENGKIINEKNANIFLKNSSLLYKRGTLNMEADMSQIKSVAFDDRLYLHVDTLLAYIVDTVKNNKLLCATLIDVEAYKNQLLNNRQITNLELGNHVNVTSMDLASDEEKTYPLIELFFYEIDGKFIKVHERTILRKLPKDKRRLFKTVIQSPNFRWNDTDSLLKLLSAIS